MVILYDIWYGMVPYTIPYHTPYASPSEQASGEFYRNACSEIMNVMVRTIPYHTAAFFIQHQNLQNVRCYGMVPSCTAHQTMAGSYGIQAS